MDKVRRIFLWGRNDRDGRGISLLNWETVCIPKKWKGMDIINFNIQNVSLLLRWWWRLYREPETLWTVWAKRLRTIRTYQTGPCIWSVSGSFFWSQLLKLRGIFNWCTQWEVGDGASVAFWYDAWQGTTLRDYRDGLPRPRQPHISLRDAMPILDLLLPASHDVQNMVFSDLRDTINWRWGKQGEYSARSAYAMLVGGGKIAWRFVTAWSAKCPATVRIFAFLTLQAKILTHDVLAGRHIQCYMGCLLCNSPTESALHLLFIYS